MVVEASYLYNVVFVVCGEDRHALALVVHHTVPGLVALLAGLALVAVEERVEHQQECAARAAQVTG